MKANAATHADPAQAPAPHDAGSRSAPPLDVLIVGAGISGISAAVHLRQQCPDKHFAILEARSAAGGTWDLFRYPGIRSDSDMHTFGFRFKPWTGSKAIADGDSIRDYLLETVTEYRLDDHIHFQRRVSHADWNSTDQLWTVTSRDESGQEDIFQSRLLFMCSGYYDYDTGYTPDIPGLQSFRGTLVHPQHWPENLDYRDRQVVVIGSGATAVTLVPAMAAQAAKVTMVQRSPTYIVSRPERDRLANLLNVLLPEKWAYGLIRWRNIRFQNFIYKRARKHPDKVRNTLLRLLRKKLGDDFDIATHFTPDYEPWTQRLCLVPDADLFKVLKSGKADVVTGSIERITESGVRMTSGAEIPADILVTATGLTLKLLGGVSVSVDGAPIEISQCFSYQGLMLSGVPNLVQTFGYINVSWTLRADLNSQFVCDLLKEMDRRGANVCVASLEAEESAMAARDWVTDFNPGYMRRSLHLLPRQGDRMPWLNTQDYLLDRKLLAALVTDDPHLHFS